MAKKRPKGTDRYTLQVCLDADTLALVREIAVKRGTTASKFGLEALNAALKAELKLAA